MQLKYWYSFCRRTCLRCGYYSMLEQKSHPDQTEKHWYEQWSLFCRITLERNRLKCQMWAAVSSFHITLTTGPDRCSYIKKPSTSPEKTSTNSGMCVHLWTTFTSGPNYLQSFVTVALAPEKKACCIRLVLIVDQLKWLAGSAGCLCLLLLHQVTPVMPVGSGLQPAIYLWQASSSPSASRASASPCAGDKLLLESFLPIVLGKRTREDFCCCWLLSLPLIPLGRGANPSLWCGNGLLDFGWVNSLINKELQRKQGSVLTK